MDNMTAATTMSDGVGQRGAEDEENVQRESRKEGEERVTVGDMVLDDGGSDSHERAREFLETECWNGDEIKRIGSSKKSVRISQDEESIGAEEKIASAFADRNRAMFRKQATALQSTFASLRAEEESKKECWSHFKAQVFGITSRQPGVRGSRLIHPLSPFRQFVVVWSTILLMYTALVVPVIIAFKWDEPNPCWRNPLLELDMGVDTFFLIEICLHFATGLYVRGTYRDDWRFVARQYIHGGLAFDLITSLPVSYVEFVVLQGCGGDEAGSTDISKFRFTRLIKPFRIVRMARVLRAMKSVDMTAVVERWLSMPPIFSRLIRVLFTIMAVTHLTASLFWLVKVSATERDGVMEFMEGNGLPADASFLQKYILSVYFVQTVFTTVGFGDVHATNTAEQLVCIVIMLMGVMVFGTLLAEVESGMAEMRLMVRERAQFLHRLKNFLRDKGVGLDLERRILDWVDFDFTMTQQEKRTEISMSHLSPDLKRELEEHLLEGRLASVAFLDIPHVQDVELQLDVHRTGQSVLFPKGSLVYESEEAEDFMLVLQEGSIRVTDVNGANVAMLEIGHVIGPWNLMGHHDPLADFGMPVLYLADTNVHCLRFDKTDFEDVLATYPDDVRSLINAKLQERKISEEFVRATSFISYNYQIAAAKWNAIVVKKLRKVHREAQKAGHAFGATGLDLLKGIQRKGMSSPIHGSSPAPRGGVPLSRPNSPPIRSFASSFTSREASVQSVIQTSSREIVHGALEFERPVSACERPVPSYHSIQSGLMPRIPSDTMGKERLGAMEGKLSAVSSNVLQMRGDLDSLRTDVSSLVSAVASLTQVLERGGQAGPRSSCADEKGADDMRREPKLVLGDHRDEGLSHFDQVATQRSDREGRASGEAGASRGAGRQSTGRATGQSVLAGTDEEGGSAAPSPPPRSIPVDLLRNSVGQGEGVLRSSNPQSATAELGFTRLPS